MSNVNLIASAFVERRKAWAELARRVQPTKGKVGSLPPHTDGVADPFAIRRKWTNLTTAHTEQGTPECDIVRTTADNASVELASGLEVAAPAPSTPRLFCLVFTTHANHASKAVAVLETWLNRCDGALLVSNVADPDLPTVTINHDGADESNNLWQKLRAAFLYVHDNYLDQFDFFLKADDDSYVIPDNVKSYIIQSGMQQTDSSGEHKPFYLGRRFKLHDGKLFNAGAGYILNREAMVRLRRALPVCSATMITHADDAVLGLCLETEGVEPYDTRDSDGREHFHVFSPSTVFNYRTPIQPGWYEEYSFDVKPGMNGVAPKSCVFHYVSANDMRNMDSLLRKCDNKSSAGD
jgi:glycoprotein-N-acetylgalactosamine 3-beta-galactosyltransferase